MAQIFTKAALSIVVLQFFSFPGADAQSGSPVNCESLKNSLAPYQVTRRSTVISPTGATDEEEHVTQVFRDSSGDAIVWESSLSKSGMRVVTRSIQYNGFTAESDAVRVFRASDGNVALSSIKAKTRYQGINLKNIRIQMMPHLNSI